MQKPDRERPLEHSANRNRRLLWFIICAFATVMVLSLLPTRSKNQAPQPNRLPDPRRDGGWTAMTTLPKPERDSGAGRSAEEIVGEKVSLFAKDRRAITQAMAKRCNVPLPAEVERFFDLVEAGNWDELKAGFNSLQKLKQSDEKIAEHLNQIWGPIHETFGVAEVAHEWPARQLLNYGEAILGALRPGMVYVGGTDAGRFIPTLLNATSGGDPHVILTQNALADNTYLQYLDFLHGERLTALAQTDSQSSFQEYIADAQKRLMHDQQAPEEPKQVRPGEDIRVTENRVQVSGQVAVMAINEKLLQQFMEKNPELSFALEESFPLKSTYQNAVPLGPVMELNSPPEHPFTKDMANQAIDYWNGSVEELLADPGVSSGSAPRTSWSKLILSQAHLFEDRKFDGQAERAYSLALKLAPENPEAVFSYVNLLLQQGRAADAAAVAEGAVKADPNQPTFQQLLEQTRNLRQSK